MEKVHVQKPMMLFFILEYLKMRGGGSYMPLVPIVNLSVSLWKEDVSTHFPGWNGEYHLKRGPVS